VGLVAVAVVAEGEAARTTSACGAAGDVLRQLGTPSVHSPASSIGFTNFVPFFFLLCIDRSLLYTIM
jgi:hypothetical protein